MDSAMLAVCQECVTKAIQTLLQCEPWDGSQAEAPEAAPQPEQPKPQGATGFTSPCVVLWGLRVCLPK